MEGWGWGGVGLPEGGGVVRVRRHPSLDLADNSESTVHTHTVRLRSLKGEDRAVSTAMENRDLRLRVAILTSCTLLRTVSFFFFERSHPT